MTEAIDILLATFNGARFLPEQLASIAAQTNRDWRLLVRDDGSSDDTLAIVQDFAQRHGGRVRVLGDGRGRLGACGNFAALLEASDAPYFTFCDQDDVWLPDKIAALRQTLRKAEERHGIDTPVLVHSDLVVVDDDLRVVDRSFWRYARFLDPSARGRPARIMLRNFVIGCASMGNSALRRAALPIPAEAYMHDWWVGLVAAMLGEICEHEAPMVLYRQHALNELGAASRSFWNVAAQFLHAPSAEVRRVRFYIEKARQQAACFQKMCICKTSPYSRSMILEFVNLPNGNFFHRKTFILRYGLWPDYWLASAIFWWFL